MGKKDRLSRSCSVTKRVWKIRKYWVDKGNKSEKGVGGSETKELS